MSQFAERAGGKLRVLKVIEAHKAYPLVPLATRETLTQFRGASNGEVIHGPKGGFSLVPFRGGYFFS